MAQSGASWENLRSMECKGCAQERERRTRLLAKNDTCLQREPYVSAPYIHKNNQAEYHAMLLRAAGDAKRKRQYTLWFAATDGPENPAQVTKSPNKLQKRLELVLQFHDQKTAGISGLNLIYNGMGTRVTEES